MAIKKRDPDSMQGMKEFAIEIRIVSGLRHPPGAVCNTPLVFLVRVLGSGPAQWGNLRAGLR